METETHVLFYGAANPYGEFSNFYMAEFVMGGVRYNCSEQRFMIAKLEAFDPGNAALRKQIMTCTKPQTIKSLGRSIANFDEKVWFGKRYGAMLAANMEKFRQNPPLLAKLLDTGAKVLVEASPRDYTWGAGCTAQKILETGTFKGQNLLGNVLMEVRTHLGAGGAGAARAAGAAGAAGAPPQGGAGAGEGGRWAIYGRTAGAAGLQGEELDAWVAAELERQRAFCVAYAERHGLRPNGERHWFADRCAADVPPDDRARRPQLQALLASGATGVICVDGGRVWDLESAGRWLRSLGVEFRSATGA